MSANLIQRDSSPWGLNLHLRTSAVALLQDTAEQGRQPEREPRLFLVVSTLVRHLTMGPATRYGRQRRQARNPAASALAASSKVRTFSARCQPKPPEARVDGCAGERLSGRARIEIAVGSRFPGPQAGPKQQPVPFAAPGSQQAPADAGKS